MRKALLITALFLSVSPALAENWVNAGELQYDADSVYVEAASGLLVFTSCQAENCVPNNAEQMVQIFRVDCDAGTEATFDPVSATWSAPLMRDNALGRILCAKKASWPKK